MDIVHPRVAGIDVHKKIIWVAVRLPGERPGERKVTVRSFRTFWRSLQKMAAWLAELGVTDAAMESTGVYWWPVYHALAQAGIPAGVLFMITALENRGVGPAWAFPVVVAAAGGGMPAHRPLLQPELRAPEPVGEAAGARWRRPRHRPGGDDGRRVPDAQPGGLVAQSAR